MMRKLDNAFRLIIILDVTHLECLNTCVIYIMRYVFFRIKNVSIRIVTLVIKKDQNVITLYYI